MDAVRMSASLQHRELVRARQAKRATTSQLPASGLSDNARSAITSSPLATTTEHGTSHTDNHTSHAGNRFGAGLFAWPRLVGSGDVFDDYQV
ncbi:hypothetical protein IWQ60_011341 [Tieghemiomyces parasiticus]|uniref:Uncharacterized protein n=1 Tax=Tieghemiomyces parasiticus TaxID=78921 RepID=A0A9W8DIJ4_9FUNG|nr:hypothetical protein IWQ60_011341 [Tieghemiomyces parasiticus]